MGLLSAAEGVTDGAANSLHSLLVDGPDLTRQRVLGDRMETVAIDDRLSVKPGLLEIKIDFGEKSCK